MKVCVIPTNRPSALKKWLEVWQPVADWDKLIVVFDGPPEEAPRLSSDIEVWDWETIRMSLGDKHWIISAKDSAIRCFGFYRAWQLGATYIGTLDDDCFPTGQNWMALHAEASIPRWETTLRVDDIRVRGLPYDWSDEFQPVLNIGLWKGNPDLDAPNRLVRRIGSFTPTIKDHIVPCNQFVPMCAMNLGFRADFTPAMFFPLMGYGYPYRRMDDIWCGVIAKRIADHLRLCWTVGEPLVEHRQLSDPMKALAAEAPGIVANETFWRWVMCGKISGETPANCMTSLAESLVDYCGEYPDAEYKRKLCEAMRVWASLFVTSTQTVLST